MLLNPDFRDMLSALLDAEIDFMIVGAYAMAAHGYPRATGDIDIWVRADAETAPKLYRTLAEFGAPMHDLTLEDLASPGIVFQIGVAPVRIDILTELSGLDFSLAWQNRIEIEMDDLNIPVIARGDLLANKRATGRAKDIADAETLENDLNDD
ncbi:MAG: nucleotidyltransferase [bacterium]|nr:nucleotidyltransferase [bacterium]